LREDLGEYITEQEAYGCMVHKWHHMQFSEYVVHNFLAQEDQARQHRQLVEYYGGAYSSPNKILFKSKKDGTEKWADRMIPLQPLEFSHGSFNLLKIAELPFHQTRSAKDPTQSLFKNTLLSIDFILVKIRARLYDDLVFDYAEAVLKFIGKDTDTDDPWKVLLVSYHKFLVRYRHQFIHNAEALLRFALHDNVLSKSAKEFVSQTPTLLDKAYDQVVDMGVKLLNVEDVKIPSLLKFKNPFSH